MVEFEYLTPTGRGVCGVTEVPAYERGRGPNVVMFTELPDNKGMSVTNAYELIAEQWIARSGYNPAGAIWIEHYPGTERREPSFDLVGLEWIWSMDHWFAEGPSWKRVSWEFVCEIIPEEDIPSWN